MNIEGMVKTSFLAIVIAFLSFCANSSIPSGKGPIRGVKIRIEKEWRGYYCGITGSSELVIVNENQWKTLWGKVHSLQLPQPQLPKIDFDKEMVIAVFMGEQKSGGYAIEIKEIIKSEEEITVVLEKREPPPGSIQTLALSQPYHIAVIKKFSLPVTFH
jgi:hypothetical protein